MPFELATPAFGTGLLAESGDALLSWTPETFYLVAALAQAVIIFVGYRLLGADPEHNTVTAALICAALGNVVAFAVRTHGVVGFTVTALGFYGLLLLTSGVDIFRSLFVFLLVIGSYGALGTYIAKNTPLDAYDIEGVPKVIMTGGFKPEPLERKDGDTVPYLDEKGEPEDRDGADDRSDP
jgi:hypothetical protein